MPISPPEPFTKAQLTRIRVRLVKEGEIRKAYDKGYAAGRTNALDPINLRRERIATSAIVALMAAPGSNYPSYDAVASDALHLADALIAALDAEPGKGGT